MLYIVIIQIDVSFKENVLKYKKDVLQVYQDWTRLKL